MRARMIGGLAAVGFLAFATVVAGQVWVSDDGQAHTLSSGMHAVMIADEGGERFDLADLSDGETRIFGQGAKQLTATRSGDEVVLNRPARGDESEVRVTCRLSSDSCSVVTFADEPEKVMLIVQKTRECSGDDAECEADLDILSGVGGSDAHVFLRKVECDGANCRESEEELDGLAGVAGHGTVKVVRTGAPGEVMIVERESRVSLRCPQGDTTMRVEGDDADKTYLCPKHSLPLEKAKAPVAGTVRVVRTK